MAKQSVKIKTRFGGVEGVTVSVWLDSRGIVATWCDGYGYQKVRFYPTPKDFVTRAMADFTRTTSVKVAGKKGFIRMLERANLNASK